MRQDVIRNTFLHAASGKECREIEIGILTPKKLTRGRRKRGEGAEERREEKLRMREYRGEREEGRGEEGENESM